MAADMWLAKERQQTISMSATTAVATVTATQTTADVGTSTATPTTGAAAGQTPLPVLAAALPDGTWMYRGANAPPPQWLTDAANGQGGERSQRVATLLRQEPDVARQHLARELMTSRTVERLERVASDMERDNRERTTTFPEHAPGSMSAAMDVEMSGASPIGRAVSQLVGAENEDVDMALD